MLPNAIEEVLRWTSTATLRVNRKPNRHLAIGASEHFCLGGTPARAEFRLLYD